MIGSRSFHIAMAPLSNLGSNPSAEDWEEHRARCIQLYVNENKTLPEVISILAHDGFRATLVVLDFEVNKSATDQKPKVLRCTNIGSQNGA